MYQYIRLFKVFSQLYARNSPETSWLLNGILYIIRTIDAEYLSKVELGLSKFNPNPYFFVLFLLFFYEYILFI